MQHVTYLKLIIHLIPFEVTGAAYKSPKVTSTSPTATSADALSHFTSVNNPHLEIRDNANDVNEAAARLLILTVRWTRTIPSFSQV